MNYYKIVKNSSNRLKKKNADNNDNINTIVRIFFTKFNLIQTWIVFEFDMNLIRIKYKLNLDQCNLKII